MQKHTLHLEPWLGRGITTDRCHRSLLLHPHLDGIRGERGASVGMGEGGPGRLISGVRAEQRKAEHSAEIVAER
jgi:hypothetical protein